MPTLSAIGSPPAAESNGPEHLLPFERVRCTFNRGRARAPARSRQRRARSGRKLQSLQLSRLFQKRLYRLQLIQRKARAAGRYKVVSTMLVTALLPSALNEEPSNA